MTSEEVIEKIKKLLSLANSPVPAEAQAALVKAHQLMAQYNVEVLENDIDQKASVEMENLETLGTKTVSAFQWHMAKELSHHYGVRALKVVGSSGSNISFVGYRVNNQACMESFRFAWKAYQFNCAQFLKKLGHTVATSDKRKARWDYFLGFVSGLTNELSLTEHATALVIVEPKEVKEKLDSMNCETFTTPKRSVGFVDVARVGYTDGAYSYRNKNKAIES